MQGNKQGQKRPKEPSKPEVAARIAEQLHVEDEQEQAQIERIVQELGRTQARALCKEALQIEAQGETPSQDQDHRSPGAIFLHLVQTKGQPKKHAWLQTSTIATTIAEQLHETEEQPRAQIQRIVHLLGEEQAMHYLQEALRIEETGGMMLADNSRRRTPGGVFFYLVRGAVPSRIRAKIFSPMGKQAVQATQEHPSSSATEPSASPAVLVWSERHTTIQEAELEKGQATTVKITVIGRPGRIVERSGCIATVVQATKIPALPKGLPVPPQPVTHYMLYISSKQWKKVAEAIKDEEDALIVEGYPHLDTEAKQIAVFVTTATTKKLQQAQRQAQQDKSGQN